jgi:hypothetical protein
VVLAVVDTFGLTAAVVDVLATAAQVPLAGAASLTTFVWVAVVACEAPFSCTPSASAVEVVPLTFVAAEVDACVATPLTANVKSVLALPPSFS